ncbi:hypothetical protein [Coleofasciculus sp. FACHB-129]|uniref:hypothetical protein n=1 Tax=Cyanophyceae TaxID=3028117 RepID=UPI0016884132|nr:hypothetical protein [Coleofasciculus sp. FACHB-129]MBD1895773.1 hypothetical protein [Coleofasciculus sp. FACHB-129]
MHVIVDTNVPIVANGHSNQASPHCVIICVEKLREIQQQHILVLDKDWLIIKEYMKNLSSKGQPGVGDAFLKWILTNQLNSNRCQLVQITPTNNGSFQEFPQDAALSGFDLSDRKFVVVALAHPDKPPILNAVDSDWRNFEAALASCGVRVEFLCPELKPRP